MRRCRVRHQTIFTVSTTMIAMAILLAVSGCAEGGLPERHLEATRAGQRVEVEIEATRQALSEQSTRHAVAMTSTLTAVQIAAADAELKLEQKQARKPVTTWWPVVAGLVAAMGAVWLGWRFAQVAEDRARLVQLDTEQGEPVLIIGRERFALPLRHANSYADLTRLQERSPSLVDPETQNRVTARRQATNLVQARQTAKIAQARHRGGERVVMLPSPQSRRAIRRPGAQESGLVSVAQLSKLDGAIEAGMLPKRLADAIDAEWREVKGDG